MNPRGFAPPVPGMTNTNGMSAGAVDPMTMTAVMMGNRQPDGPSSVGDKMQQVVQLLREVAQADPRLSMLVGGALQMLMEGPPMNQQGSGGGAPGASVPPAPSMPVGGPS